MSRVVGWCALALLCAGPAAAQEDRLAERLPPSALAEVRALVDSAGALALPVESVVQKALEGASKQASPEDIVRAVRALVRDLASARAALGPAATADALLLAAAALGSGASPADLGRLGERASEPGFLGALAGVVYLLSRGVGSEASVAIVDSMLRAGLTQGDFASLQRLVERDVRGGLPSTTAARLRSQALIRRVRPGGGPA